MGMYLDYYSLREKPFNVTSDPNFLYLSKRHKEALTYLIYGIKERKGFIDSPFRCPASIVRIRCLRSAGIDH